MKNFILIIGGLITILLSFLWYFNIITEPVFTIGSAILTLLGYLFIDKEKPIKKVKKIKQIHKGEGDNIAGNKTIKQEFMYNKQEHSGTGDNVAGNKYQQNTYKVKNDLNDIIQSKISNINNKQNYNLKDNKILNALKEVILELIEEEQNQSHQIVPISRVRHKFKSLFDDETFETVIKHLVNDKSIEMEERQICFINKSSKYKINI